MTTAGSLAVLSAWRERLFGQPLLAHPEAAAAVVAVLADRLQVTEIELAYMGELHGFSPAFLASAAQDQIRGLREYAVEDGIASIPVAGKLVARSASLQPTSGLTGYTAISSALDMALADQDVRGVALQVDSPGGEATGAFDLWSKVAAARGQKPIWAIVHGTAASSAYGLASAADKVVAPEFADVGSVGVVALHADMGAALAHQGVKVTVLHAGARKVDGNPFQSLPPQVAARWQDRLDQLYGRFVKIVASNRGVTQKAVKDTEAETYYGHEARDRGLVDVVATPEQAMADFRDFLNRGVSRTAKGAGMAAQDSGAALQAAAASFDPTQNSTVSSPTVTNGSTTLVSPGRAYTQADVDAAREAGVKHGRSAAAADHAGLADRARAEGREGGLLEGSKAERARVAGILRCEAAEGRAETALSLALDTDLPADQASRVLASTPRVVAEAPKVEVVAQATDFASHMATLRQPRVGADAGELDEEGQALAYLRSMQGRA